MVSLALGACSSEVDDPSIAAEETQPAAGQHRPTGYHVFTLSSLGGNRSVGNSINNLGIVTGYSRETGNTTIHATLWFFGFRHDLGSLGGPGTNSAVLWPVKNILGVVSGITEMPEVDPYGEAWSCSAFFPAATGRVCRGFVWERGVMRALPTFGGTHGFATGTNNFKQTVGWAETLVEDPSCNAPQRFQFLAALWGPGRDQMQALLPLGDDSTSAATAINDRGQVVGISGICSNAVGELSAKHAVMWHNGQVRDLGNLGVTAWNTPMSINQRGDVVGFANSPDADPETDFIPLPFIWTEEGGMQPIDLLPEHTFGQALGINEQRQVVGLSCGATCRAFIWENGVTRDLNDFVASGIKTGEYLRLAGDINDFGLISGQLVNAAGERPAFVALPIR